MELQNEVWFEEAKQNLEEACELGHWSVARAIIADTEEKGFDVSGMRRHMNLEMAKEDVCLDYKAQTTAQKELVELADDNSY